MFFVNNPPRWLVKALAIVNGDTQLQVDEVLFPVIDAMQGGWGQATYESRVQFIAVGVADSLQLDAPEGKILAVRLSVTNNGAANILITVRSAIVGGQGSVIEHIGNVPPGTTHAWYVIRPDSSWLKCVPGGRIIIDWSAGATVISSIGLIVATLPAGVTQDS